MQNEICITNAHAAQNKDNYKRIIRINLTKLIKKKMRRQT